MKIRDSKALARSLKRSSTQSQQTVASKRAKARKTGRNLILVEREDIGLPPGPPLLLRTLAVGHGRFKARQAAKPDLDLDRLAAVKVARALPEGRRKVAIQAASEPRVLNESAYAPGARAKAVLKGVQIAQEDLRSSGGAFDLDEVRELLHGVSRQRIDTRVREGSLLAVPGPSNKRRFPVVQFKEDGTVLEGLQAVSNALPTKNGFAVLNFLIHPDRRLGGRKPIDLLKKGEVDIVVGAARRLAEQGA